MKHSFEAAPDPTPPEDEELERRTQTAYERIAGDPNLTGALTDDAAEVLLHWAEDEIRRMVAETTGQPDTAAWEVLDPQLRQVRRQVRDMAETAADSPDPTGRLQELIPPHRT